MKRNVTYVVRVPMQFTFVATNDMTQEEFAEAVKKETMKRLANGYFDVLPEEYDVRKEYPHYTRQEIEAENKRFAEFFKGVKPLKGV
jgi:hypothetical protein